MSSVFAVFQKLLILFTDIIKMAYDLLLLGTEFRSFLFLFVTFCPDLLVFDDVFLVFVTFCPFAWSYRGQSYVVIHPVGN